MIEEIINNMNEESLRVQTEPNNLLYHFRLYQQRDNLNQYSSIVYKQKVYSES